MERQPERELDLRGTSCPMNWVKLKLYLEQMEAGQMVTVLLDDGDSIRSVPMSARSEGHRVVQAAPMECGFRLVIEVAGAAGPRATPQPA